jgi:hypothetical protein
MFKVFQEAIYIFILISDKLAPWNQLIARFKKLITTTPTFSQVPRMW